MTKSNYKPHKAAEFGKPNSYSGIRKMTELKDRVHAFIGPDESCACEALVASAWNKPIVSYVSFIFSIDFFIKKSDVYLIIFPSKQTKQEMYRSKSIE